MQNTAAKTQAKIIFSPPYNVIMIDMKADLEKYRNMRICAAVSGGRDSMALLHFLYVNGKSYGIKLSALNCEHGIRGETSVRDSEFVKKWCKDRNIPLICFKRGGVNDKSEISSRLWRLSCYSAAAEPCMLPGDEKWEGADAVATAHHLGDNAETVLFNLARGAALSGLTGIADISYGNIRIIRPIIACSREEIDEYVLKNGIDYVDDETNLTDDYTRNKIRHNVLPELEKAVNGADRAIYRFSRLAAEDEEYFDKIISKDNIVYSDGFGVLIKHCAEKVVFRRAAVKALKMLCPDIKDYTSENIETLYGLQFLQKGRKFEFLGITAYKDENAVALCVDKSYDGEINFSEFLKGEKNSFGGQYAVVTAKNGLENAVSDIKFFTGKEVKILKFDPRTIPESAVVRFRRKGDKFKRFGGGTKSLGDYFTDCKIPERIRGNIPLIAVDSDIYAVFGMEISDKIKISGDENTAYLVATNYSKLTC